MTILTKAAGPQRVGRVMAVLGIALGLGPIIGPVVGGWLVDEVSWRSIFYINVPIGVLTLILGGRILRGCRPAIPAWCRGRPRARDRTAPAAAR
jgi:MFS family permease